MDSRLALVIAIVVVAYVSRRRWPFSRCWACRGSGRNGGSNGRRWGICGRCGGSGTRRRLGTRRDR